MVSFSMLLLNGNEANYIYEQHAILFIFFFRFELFFGAQGRRCEPPRLMVKHDDS
jgi:hypothetical protein